MSKKHKALLKKEHPDSRYILDAEVKGETMSVCYAVLTSTGFIVYKHKEKKEFVVVSRLNWDSIEKAIRDKFFMKTEYTFTTSEGKVSHLILSDPNLNDEGNHFIQKCISPEIQAAKRKWYRKIVGFRSKTTWKMITAIIIYFGLFSGVMNAFGEEEVSKSASNKQEVKSEEIEEEKDSTDSINKPVNSSEEDSTNPESTDSDKEKDTNSQALDDTDTEQESTSANSDSDHATSAESNSLPSKPTSSNPDLPTATVTRVVDGDTLEINMNGKIEDVRLLLVDTPETVHPSKPVEPFGPEASQFVKNKLTGQEVRIKVGTEERDHYGRLLAYVYIDGTTIQEVLLKKGLARTAYLYNDLTMLEEFHEAQNNAKTQGIGVWSIPGYAHADHNHGYHYQEKEPEPEPKSAPAPEPEVEEEPAPKPDNSLAYDPFGADRDCGDFSTHQQAQAFFMAAGGPGDDPHRLDGSDGDGLACESLP